MLYAGITEDLELPKSENAPVRSISREGNLAWLAGIIDGEGNLHYPVQTKPSGVNKVPNDYFCPKLRITNTDVRMIRKISEIYVEENLTFFYALNSVKRYKNRKDTWKNQMEITLGSQQGIKKLLQLVLPYLVNKRVMAELLIETIEWVQEQPWRGRMSRQGVNYTLKPEFRALIDEMKKEREFHIEPSTITRKAREVLSW
ncbi:MAG: hypothetical protein NUV75_07810 [Gallionella sp.]|nr:hypothetical protein [Gallionella sp.]